jgi:uncharacterized SAM-binding protein YcdF (DUF218 family)
VIYLLKFGASFLLPPGIFIVAFMVMAVLLWKKQERNFAKALAGITIAFYLLSTGWVSELLLGSLESRYEPPSELTGDAVIMLGGGATSDTTDVDGLGNLGGSAANRLLTAARLQKKLDVPIILTGGQVYADSGREAQIGKRMLLSLGIPEDKIMIEDQSLNTKQNAQFVHKLLNEKGYSKPILVTSAFHMERSVINFHKENIDVVPYPSDYMVNKNHVFHYNKLAPSAGALCGNYIFLQEWLGILVAKIVK